MSQIVFTTAPVEYDYSTTIELDSCVATTKDGRKTYRKVEIDESVGVIQLHRYESGLYNAVRQSEFDKLVSYGLVILNDVAEKPNSKFQEGGPK